MKRVALLLALVALCPAPAGAVSRAEALARARAYAEHPWRAQAKNLTADCSAAYQSIYPVGDYVGLPYDWGGYVTLHQFDLAMQQGQGAGSYPEDGILACTAGVDCSGYVSRVWKAGHTTTSGMDTIAQVINQADLRPADVFNWAGYHVMLFEGTKANGDPLFYESAGLNAHHTFWESWSYTSGFTPMRYGQITDDPPAYADGTPDDPVVVTSFPFVDARDTARSLSDLFDACLGAAPGTGEAGSEVVYRLDLTQPGTVTVAVQDGAGVDIDVHVYRALNEADCVARHDSLLSYGAGCGPLYVVLDTYSTASAEYPGAYELTIDFAPSGQPCGAPDLPYDPQGAPMDVCGNPSQPALPPCNPNLGGVVCLYTSPPGATSFCTYPCVADADCAADFPGGCCAAVDADLDACMPASFCGPVTPDQPPDHPPEASPEAASEMSVELPVEAPVEAHEVIQPAEIHETAPPADQASPDAPAADLTSPDSGAPRSDPDAPGSTDTIAPDTLSPEGDASGPSGCHLGAPARPSPTPLLLVLGLLGLLALPACPRVRRP